MQQFEPNQQKFITYKSSHGPGSISGNDVRGVSEDEKGNLWLAVHGSGISRFNHQTKKFINFNTADGLVNDWTNDILCDAKKRVWIGTYGGLGMYDRNKHEFHKYQNNPEDSTSLSDYLVRTIFEDSEGNIWVGTDRGLNRFEEASNSFVRLLRKDGLLSDHICAIEEDNAGFLWISTKGGGLIKFDRKSWEANHKVVNLTVYDKGDGILSKEFNYNASYKDQAGNLYFGGSNGLTVFDPAEIQPNRFVPKVIISDLKLFNQSVYGKKSDLQLEKEVAYLEKLLLNYDQNVITFQFTAFNFVQPQENRYAYKLVGFDKSWYYIGTKREITYTNLPPGQYTLQVKASNNDGIWNEAGTSLLIEIFPPWWNTLTFRIFLFLLIVFVIFSLFYLRMRRMKEFQGHLQQLVKEKTTELAHQNEQMLLMAQKVHEADVSKIKFFMNISHEFKTPLSLILGPAEEIMNRKNLSAELKDNFSYIVRNARRLLRLINQVLDLRKIESGELALQVYPLDLNEFIRNITASFNYLAHQKNIDFQFVTFQANQPIACFDPDIVEKILYNLISNAFKYTGDYQSVKVILTQGENGFVKISVSDTGKGISPEKLPLIFDRFYSSSERNDTLGGTGIGLSLVKEMVTLHGGSIEVQSEENAGSTFTVNLPVSKEHFPEDAIVNDPAYANQEAFFEEAGLHIASQINNATQKEFTLLLVEDDNDLKGYLSGVLGQHYTVVAVSHGKEALQFCEKQFPDIIVSDIMMPCDGWF